MGFLCNISQCFYFLQQMVDTKTKGLFHTCLLNYNTYLTQKGISWTLLHMNSLIHTCIVKELHCNCMPCE
jgi:hypothetical protein